MRHLKLFEQFDPFDPFGEESLPKEKIEVGDYIKILNNRGGNHTFKEGDILEVEKILNLYKTFYFVKIPALIRKMSNKKHIGFEAFMEDNVRKATEEEVKNSKKFINKIKHLLENKNQNMKSIRTFEEFNWFRKKPLPTETNFDPFGEEFPIGNPNVFIEKEHYELSQFKQKKFKVYLKIDESDFLYLGDIREFDNGGKISYLNLFKIGIEKRNMNDLRNLDADESYIARNAFNQTKFSRDIRDNMPSWKDYLETKYNIHITI